jgi:plasmid stabilization system protein ParE
VHDRTGNRVLDFFNRETVSGNPLVSGQQTAKLWRDYTGVVPSRHLAEALREMAANNDFRRGLQQARGQIGELVDKLEAEGTPQARKELDEIAASLNKLSANIGKPMSPRSARETVGQLFRNLDAFFEEGRAQMAHVAGLCSLQADIDDYLGMADKDTPEARQAHARLQKSYDALVQSRGTGRALTWMKFDKDTPAFEGDLAGYLAHRQRRLPQAARATMHALA